MSKFKRFVSKPLRLPLNWAVPRSSVNGVREFKFSSSRYPICPNCSLARFLPVSNTDDDRHTIWECPKCHFEAKTRGGSLSAIQKWMRENAHDTFFDSQYQQDRIQEYDNKTADGFLNINVRRNMMACYIFLIAAGVLFLMFLYGFYNLNWFLMLNSFLFVLALMFMALTFNYRAWQAMTRNMYSVDGKAQFHWWIKNHTWYVHPRDIGDPPFKKLDQNDSDLSDN